MTRHPHPHRRSVLVRGRGGSCTSTRTPRPRRSSSRASVRAAHAFSRFRAVGVSTMASESSSSDSDDVFVHKKARVVKWSDDESSGDDAPLAGAAATTTRTARPGGTDAGSTRSSARACAGVAPTDADVVEIIDDEEDAPSAAPTSAAAAAFLELPPRSFAVRRDVNLDPIAQEALRKTREAMAEHRRAAAREAVVQVSDDEEDADEAAAPATTPAAPSGEKIILFMQLRNGRRLKCACREDETFGKILEDFLASGAGEAARDRVGASPRLVFDGVAIDPASTPADLDMGEDVVDLQ